MIGLVVGERKRGHKGKGYVDNYTEENYSEYVKVCTDVSETVGSKVGEAMIIRDSNVLLNRGTVSFSARSG